MMVWWMWLLLILVLLSLVILIILLLLWARRRASRADVDQVAEPRADPARTVAEQVTAEPIVETETIAQDATAEAKEPAQETAVEVKETVREAVVKVEETTQEIAVEVEETVQEAVAEVEETAQGTIEPAVSRMAETVSLEPPPPPDDLKIIEGIGPKISSVFQAAGITTLAKLAATDVTELQHILDEANIRLGDPGTWPEQAGLAAEAKWEELASLQQTLKGGRRV